MCIFSEEEISSSWFLFGKSPLYRIRCSLDDPVQLLKRQLLSLKHLVLQAASEQVAICQVDGVGFYIVTRSLGALRAPTSSLWPFGPPFGPSGLLDFVLRALRALRPCDPWPVAS